ncbi:nucleotidyltransferase domain-containing protein [Candidatus Micrarchaeota archaeon]|nr:nucleotidyltransferase domain-containing protein [Candidatus Micrarchaeota archaeon]
MSFHSFAGIKVLGWFLEHPTQKAHFRELCRHLKLHPLTVKSYCDEFLENEWLLEERKANLRIFFLNDGHFAIKSMKRAYFLEKLRELKIASAVDETVISFALYGSHASGEYDEKSDVDFLVVGRREGVDSNMLKNLERKLGKSVQLTVISLEKWERNKEKDPFALSVLRNNVLLGGALL